jgi:hypothetical protein
LKDSDLKEVEKVCGILSLPEIHVNGDGSKITINAADSKNPNGDLFSIEVGPTTKTFNAIFKVENIKIIPGDYEVSISSRGVSHYAGKDAEYWIAVESNSTF